ncbi:hypothetical protein [Microbacterium sp.]|uniref:hypothetical protein n=1 Tax=Microbacterium sp. TaxID=51671 RepID=UPI003F9C7E80
MTETTNAEEITWTLTQEEFAATQDRAAAINRRAVKRGFTGRIEVTGVTREITETDEAGLPRTRVVVDVAISGEAPRYNGWQFLAAVDTIETEDGHDFVIRSAPGVEETGVDRSTLGPGRCEHCNTVRANRRYTYLVRHAETGETRQVGSTCIKDFTGWTGKPVFISDDELRRDLADFLGGFTSSGPEYSPETVVAVAWAISREFGWVPAAAAYPGKTATRDLVSSYLYGKSRADRELRKEVAPEIATASDMAKTIIPALLEGLDGSGDYVTNLKTCLRAAHVEHRHLGIVVSAVAAYERMTGETARRKAEAEERARQRAESQYAGTVGEKIAVTGTVTRLVPIKGSYGYNPTTSMLVIVEGGTTVAKMFTAAAWAWEVEQGDEITVSATVKAHEDYQGIKQTALTRPKLIEKTTPEGSA